MRGAALRGRLGDPDSDLCAESGDADMLGVALARSASGQRWPEPGEAVNLIVSGIGERLAGMLRRPDQRDTAAVMAIAGPVLMAAAAARTAAGPFMLDPVLTTTHTSPNYFGMLTVPYWQVGVALVTAASALGSLRFQDRPISWRAVTALAVAAAILAGWPAAEVAAVTYTPLTANSGTISDPLSGLEGWLTDGLFAGVLILMLAAIVALRPAVRRRAAVLLLPAFVTTTLVCWGFQGWLPTGTPFGPLVLSPLEWEVLVLVPVVGVAACFAGLRLYERLLRRHAATTQGDQPR